MKALEVWLVGAPLTRVQVQNGIYFAFSFSISVSFVHFSSSFLIGMLLLLLLEAEEGGRPLWLFRPRPRCPFTYVEGCCPSDVSQFSLL